MIEAELVDQSIIQPIIQNPIKDFMGNMDSILNRVILSIKQKNHGIDELVIRLTW